MKPNQVSVPKSFFIAERDKFYDSWHEAYWREFFQNSVDARARTIEITLSEATPKGSFGEAPRERGVTRITFSDDGGGMSEAVLNDVFFALGESTKRDSESSVGGFGRARIMQAFSQARYAIRTQDRYVSGDGAQYLNLDVATACEQMAQWAEKARARADEARTSGDAEAVAGMEATAAALQEDLRALAQGPAFLKGCRFEVDLDPAVGDSDAKRPTVERMRAALHSYLASSEIPCRVIVDGTEFKPAKRKMDGRRKLAATMDASEVPAHFAQAGVEVLERADGKRDVVFGVLNEVRAEDATAAERGRLNVRVRGASMFKVASNASKHALVLELVPSVARDVLTSNRDTLRSPYKEAVEQLTRMMATDANKALQEQEDDSFEILHGGLSHRTRKRARPDISATAEVPESAPDRLRVMEHKARTTTRHVSHDRWDWSSTVEKGIDGVPFADIRSFLDGLRDTPAAETFLAMFGDRAKAEGFRETLIRQGEHQALAYASGEMLGFIVEQLRYRRALADHERSDRNKDKLSDLNDLPILRRRLQPPSGDYTEKEAKVRRSAMRKAMDRYNPLKWDRETGKGRGPHRLLTAWSVAVDNCVDLLLESHPNVAPFPYSTGWSFSHKERGWLHGSYGWRNEAALYWRPNKNDEMCHFLLNPLNDEDFGMRFDPNKEDDLARIVALALHEVAHRLTSDHNEDFACTMTDMMELLTPSRSKAIYKEMQASMRAVHHLYGKGRTKVRAMDDEPGQRPATRLLDGLVREADLAQRPGGFDVDCGALDDTGLEIGERLARSREEEGPSLSM